MFQIKEQEKEKCNKEEIQICLIKNLRYWLKISHKHRIRLD